MATINSISCSGSTHTFSLPYGTCSTTASTAAKTVTVTNFSLETGARILIKFTVTNTAGSPTLNVNSTGAKSIMYRGSAISAGYLAANRVYEFVYDGTDWELIGDIDTNTTYSFSASNPTLSWGSTSTIGTAGGTTYKVTMPANPNTDTKVTAVGNHYTPSANSSYALSVDASSTSSATWGSTSLVTGVNLSRDAAGHVTGVTVDSIRMPSNPNSDTKVTQTVTTSNAAYPILLAPSGQTATATTTSYFDSGVTLNPSTNTIAAHISGNAATATTASSCSGNAATATKLATARTISLTGDVTGSGSFNGSSNLSITATVADNSHSHSDYVSKSSGAVQSIMGGLVIGGGSATATGVGRIMLTGAGNPLIGLQAINSEGEQLTPYYFQVSNDIMYLGPTSAKALAFDLNGNVTAPADLTVKNNLTVDKDAAINEDLAVTGTITMGGKLVATQEWVNTQIAAAITTALNTSV